MQTDTLKPESPDGFAPATGSALASKLLNALRKLTKECVPHPWGGFTTDDMKWRIGTAFTGEEALTAALDELQAAKLIRYAGYDDEDAIGHCYAIAKVSGGCGKRAHDGTENL